MGAGERMQRAALGYRSIGSAAAIRKCQSRDIWDQVMVEVRLHIGLPQPKLLVATM